jgi:hypothetical protein
MAETSVHDVVAQLAGFLAVCQPAEIRHTIAGVLAECERLGAGGAEYDAMLLELATDIRQRAAVGRWPGSGGRRWGH